METGTTTIVLLFLSAMVSTTSNAMDLTTKETHMQFYMQDRVTGKNATASPVAKRTPKSTPNDYGTIVVIDDAVTEGPKRNSAEVGRAQGIYVNSKLDGSDIHLVFSIVFTNAKYNGSTLEIQGADRYLLKSREVSVVSGTGLFRFVRGFAVLETIYFKGFNAVVKFNVTLRHY